MFYIGVNTKSYVITVLRVINSVSQYQTRLQREDGI